MAVLSQTVLVKKSTCKRRFQGAAGAEFAAFGSGCLEPEALALDFTYPNIVPPPKAEAPS